MSVTPLFRRLRFWLERVVRGSRLARLEKEVRESGLFEDKWYLDTYTDVRAMGLDPLSHFMRFGWREQRSPNRLFDTTWYVETYPDVNFNPLLHYIRHGAIERRDTGPHFRPSVFQDPATSRGAHHMSAALSYLRELDGPRFGGFHAAASPPRVLIVAELSIAQCKKYRVDQKQELLRRLGVKSTVIEWREAQACMKALLTHSLVIFYRVPAAPNVIACVEEAKRLGLRTIWEVDDLIFDPNIYILNTNLRKLDHHLQRGVLGGVPFYRQAMLACDEAIASTADLALAMRDAGVPVVHVIENALDRDTLEIANALALRFRRRDDRIRIVYGSGTKTHDRDFLEAADALIDLFDRFPKLTLRIIGELNLPKAFESYADRIEYFDSTSYDRFLQLLWECDIAIAPLEAGVFNDAKSNIKFLEASVIGLPCVCSPRAAFLNIVEHGRNGLLAASRDAWFTGLASLVADAGVRSRLASAAKADVLARYDPDAIAERQVAPVLGPAPARKPLRVLMVNIFYAPRSFGGATIVAEQLAQRLNARDDTEVFVFTAAPQGARAPYELSRYSVSGVSVFAVGLPETADTALDFDTPHTVAGFRDVLEFLQPDVVHFHSMQGLGARLLEQASETGIPIVATLHDAWWICGRQFMVTGEGTYCFQRKVDLNVCASCVPDPSLNIYRQYRLREALQLADLLLTPSDFFTDLYRENFGELKIETNRNGIGRPIGYARSPGKTLRFGFVGGNADLKGAGLIRTVLSRLNRSDYELVLIDNMLSLGFTSIKREDWPVRGELTVVPAYTQDTMDDFFGRIDVLLFPTQWKESFGLTVREALIRDIWVIATDAGGVVEDIVDGENGTIIPLLDDGAALEAAIVDLLDRAETLKTHVNQHKQKIFDYDRQAEELHRRLAEVAAAGRAKDARPETETAVIRRTPVEAAGPARAG